ncbi:DUF6011 domain-containing protein [Mycolicibacter virginiensis]|uniref:DUF6011 domain-containing protein n=1 Tax=Mycolicibacter virginiensis TaxID=1795032 RepID=UPI0033133BE8
MTTSIAAAVLAAGVEGLHLKCDQDLNTAEATTCRCLDCRRPLTAELSVIHRRGPVCRSRIGVIV